MRRMSTGDDGALVAALVAARTAARATARAAALAIACADSQSIRTQAGGVAERTSQREYGGREGEAEALCLPRVTPRAAPQYSTDAWHLL